MTRVSRTIALHWCDLNPLLDTNTDVTMTNVSYILLQKVPRVRVNIRTCKVRETVIPMYCGNYDHQTMVTPLAKTGLPSKFAANTCQQWWMDKEYNSAVSSKHPLMVNATTIILVETLGRTWVTETGKVKCKGEKFNYTNKHYEDLVINHQIAITLVQDTALIYLDRTLITHQEEILLACQASENSCATDRATYLWDTPTEQEKCLYLKSRRTKGTVVTTAADGGDQSSRRQHLHEYRGLHGPAAHDGGTHRCLWEVGNRHQLPHPLPSQAPV
jgi:hypothetical protein